MRDAFYTILVIWIVWRVLNSISAFRAAKKQKETKSRNNNSSHAGETIINYSPTMNKKIPDEEGEYVDYEEVKD